MILPSEDQIKNIQERVILLSNKYIGMSLDNENTLPLIHEVREDLQLEYPDVKVHLSYTAATKSSSVEVSTNGSNISVIFSSPVVC